MTQETLPPTTAPGRASSASGRRALALANGRVRGQLLGLVAAQPARPALPGAARPEPPGRVGDGGRAGDRGVARPHPARRPHRPLRRPDRVRRPVVRGHRPGAVPGLRHRVSGPALGGLLLGLGGASFAVGVPFVNAWFPPERAASPSASTAWATSARPSPGSSAPRVASSSAGPWAFLIVAFVLAWSAWPSCCPGATPRTGRGHRAVHDPVPGRRSAARSPATWPCLRHHLRRLRGLRRLPADLPQDRYGLGRATRPRRAAGFVVLATLARPVGGWLADRIAGVPVLHWALVVAAGADRHCLPARDRVATVAFLAMAAALGLGNGAVFALVGTRRRRVPGRQRHRPGRRGRRPRRLPPPDRHGPRPPGHRRLRDRPDAALRRRPGRAGLHRLAPGGGAEARAARRAG